MGLFKGRFCSLRGLRQQIDDALDHERALAWVKACIVIHTLIYMIEEGCEDAEYIAELIQEGMNSMVAELGIVEENEVTMTQRMTRGNQKRADLRRKLFASGVATEK